VAEGETVDPRTIVYLTGGAIDDVSSLLQRAGIEIARGDAAGDRGRALNVRIEPNRSRGGWVISFGVGMPAALASTRKFVFETPVSLAAVILSAALGLRRPFLTDLEQIFAIVSEALSSEDRGGPVLLEGETGTGKELLAAVIHAASGRAGSLRLVNCIALDDELSGENAGAIAEHSPQDAAVRSGDATLLLDHVDELTPAAQRRLAQVLRRETGGAPVPEPFRSVGRILAATTLSLKELASRGRFDRDLCAALSLRTISIPPLRDRKADVSLLARYFMQELSPGISLRRTALRVLAEYPFPGNVRELRNLITRLSILPLAGESRSVDSRDVSAQLMSAGRQLSPDAARSWQMCCRAAHREIAMRAVQACGGDQAAAARKLGVTVTALRERLAPVPDPPPGSAAAAASGKESRGRALKRRPPAL
jgi:DNA-binding NtrC family response regulator